MFDPGEVTLTGASVTLRPMCEDDAEALSQAAREDRSSYLYNWVPESVEETKSYIATALAARDHGARYPFVVEFEKRVVGTTSYSELQPWRWSKHGRHRQRDTPDVVEIGSTWLAASAQRTICNSEAKYLLFRHAFESWRVYRVSLRTDERNARSRSAIERLGATFEGIRRADVPGWDGTVRDSAFYSVVAEEWPNVKTGMEHRLYGPSPS